MPGPYLTPGVYIEEIPSGSRPIEGVGTAVVAFLGVTEKCPQNEQDEPLIGHPILVTNWEQYKEKFGSFTNGATMPLSIYGYFQNGGGVCYVESLATTKDLQTSNNKPPIPSTKTLPSRGAGGVPSLELVSQAPEPVNVVVSDATQPGDDLFKLSISTNGKPEEVYDNVTFHKGKDITNKDSTNVVTALKASTLVKVKELDVQASAEERRPVVDTYLIPAPLAPPITFTIDQATIKGSLANRTGMEGLEAIEDITMVCMPDLMVWQRDGNVSLADAVGMQNALIAHCEKMAERMANRMAILDAPLNMKVLDIKDWRMGQGAYEGKPDGANYSSIFAALYYPWIVVQNPSGKGQLLVPPSGHIAGLYARTDGERGVHKAPANEVLRGAIALERQINNEEQSLLNPNGINCIRSFPGRGIRVWGARTLAESSSEWRYISVRRLFNYIERSIYYGTQWVVFEPNDLDLWERVKRTITAFLTNVWRDGALFGATAEEAFYVKCDAELNPASVRDAGMLIVEVGLAPVKPAEFVIFRFKQMSDGGEISE